MEHHIDLADVRNERDLHDVLNKRFVFPDYYGYNWGALNDVMTGEVDRPFTIVFHNWQQLKAIMASQFDVFVDIMESAASYYGPEHPELGGKIVWS